MDRIQKGRGKITRTRELRACTECRRRKLKCDRELPCASCVQREGQATTCVYEKKLDRSEHGRRLQAEARLEHLETLVQELSQSRKATTDDENMRASTTTVQRNRDNLSDDSIYNGATHWSAMLEDIEELRTDIRQRDESEDSDVEFDSYEDQETSILFGASSSISFQQILSNFLPSRSETDRLVAAYFRAKAVSAPFIHAAQFKRIYLLFWDNPLIAQPLWTSILFSILHIATRTLPTNFAVVEGGHNRFATASAHCLAVGEYHKPQKLAVEALLLYVQSMCLTSVDISPNEAILFGTLTRIATIMGYHRESDAARDGISVFEGEMRRRTWSLCMQLDLLISFQLGIPSNIQFPTWNTRPPTNLLDSDFDEDTVRLPPARPDSEPTELLSILQSIS